MEDVSNAHDSSELALPPEFEVLSTLGKSSKSVVLKAELRMLKQTVAVKVFTHQSSSSETIARMKREAVNLAKLDHPNVVKLLQVGFLPDKSPFLVYEYLKGITLEESLAKEKLSIPDIYRIFVQVLDGLEWAHARGLIHRDLRPANIMLIMKPTTGKQHSIKILDFALSKDESTNTSAQSSTATISPVAELLANPEYLSPEQCCGLKVDARTDLYAVGCMLYECLSGSPPFTGNTNSEIMEKHITASISPITLNAPVAFQKSVYELLARALAKSPEHRFQSAGEFKLSLENAFKPYAKSSPAASSGNRKIYFSAGIAVTLLAVTAGFVFWKSSQAKTPLEANTQSIAPLTPSKSKKKHGVFASSRLLPLSHEVAYYCNSGKLTEAKADELAGELNDLVPGLTNQSDRFTAYRLQFRLYDTLTNHATKALAAELKALEQCQLPGGREYLEAAQSHFNVGTIYFNQGRAAAAEEELKKTVKLMDRFSKDPDSLVSLDLNKGSEMCDNTGDLRATCRLYLGRVYLRQGNSKKAIAYLKESMGLQEFPYDCDAQLDLAQAEFKMDKKLATQSLTNYLDKLDAFQLNPIKGGSDDFVAFMDYANVGNKLAEWGNLAGARDAFRRGIAFSRTVKNLNRVPTKDFINWAKAVGLSDKDLTEIRARFQA